MAGYALLAVAVSLLGFGIGFGGPAGWAVSCAGALLAGAVALAAR